MNARSRLFHVYIRMFRINPKARIPGLKENPHPRKSGHFAHQFETVPSVFRGSSGKNFGKGHGEGFPVIGDGRSDLAESFQNTLSAISQHERTSLPIESKKIPGISGQFPIL